MAGLSVSGGLGVALPCAPAKSSRLLPEAIDECSAVSRRLSPGEKAIREMNGLVLCSGSGIVGIESCEKWGTTCSILSTDPASPARRRLHTVISVFRPPNFIVLVDEKFRRKIHDLTTEDHLRYPNFSAGLQAALKDHDYIWAESRLEVLNSPYRHTQASAPTSKSTRTTDKPNLGKRARATGSPKGARRVVAPTVESCVGGPEPRKRAEAGTPKKETHATDQRRTDVKPRRVPEEEWRAMEAESGSRGVCKFWISSQGCQNTACTWKHACLQCEENQRWVDRHHKRSGQWQSESNASVKPEPPLSL